MAFWNKGSSLPPQTSAKIPAKNPQPHQGTESQSRPPQPAPGAAPSGGPTVPAALAGVRNIIAIASGKGGVGKSTVSTNLAIALRYAGATVGLLDADIYGPSQPGMLGAQGKQGGTTAEGALIPVQKHGVGFISMGLLMPHDGPVVWRAPMAMKAIHQFLGNVQWGNLDYLLIDLPPGTGDVQLTLAQQARLAGAVIVTTPQEVALGIAKKGLEMFRQLNIPILGIIENMSGFTCKHCGEETAVFKEGGGKKMADSLGVPYLGSIPLDPEIMLSGDEGVPVLERGDGPRSIAGQTFIGVAQELDKQVRRTSEAVGIEPVSYGVMSDGNLAVKWPDGHEGMHRPYTFRIHCGCASCVDENTGKPLLDARGVPLDIRLEAVVSVGRYALNPRFSDGHSTGIYPFKKLRSICECGDCLRKKDAGQAAFSV